jgi:hypothetical protein
VDWTVNVSAMKGNTVPSLNITCAVTVCTPFVNAAVSNAFAAPFEAVPAKSNGLTFSVILGAPVGFVGWGLSNQNFTCLTGLDVALHRSYHE